MVVPARSGVPYRASAEALDQVPVGKLTPEQHAQFRALVDEYADIFAETKNNLGRTDTIQHKIDVLPDTKPIRQPPYRLNPQKRQFIREEVQRMKAMGIIKNSKSPWAFPVVIVGKKTGDQRFCVDYRKLNEVTIKDSFPLPRIEDLLDQLAGSTYFSSIDLQSGYWQVGMDPTDEDKTAFVTDRGLYQFTVMPFGLCNAPGTFQRLMTTVTEELDFVVVYLDDVNVFSKTWEEHVQHLRIIFERFRQHGLRLNIKKCSFCASRLVFLGFVVSQEGIHTDKAMVEKMQNFPRPENAMHVRSFLGLANYYRRFVREYSRIASPLNLLLRKDQPFEWTKRQQMAFDELRQRLASAPILAYPDLSQPFQLYTDASLAGLGAVLGQKDEKGRSRIVSYASRSLSKSERNYSVTELECLGAVWAVKYFKYYLGMQTFDIYTDHRAISHTLDLRHTKGSRNGRLERWAIELQQYNYKIHYRPGHKNRADALSRIPKQSKQQPVDPSDQSVPIDLSELPFADQQ